MSSPLVAICVTTYKRPIGLARLLDAIDRMDHADARVRVFVIDNDEAGSAEAVVERARTTTNLDLFTVVERARGVTYARNRALEVALAVEPDFIVWLDDDEAPRVDWLRRVMAMQQATDADVVTGPSSPRFEPDASPWIVAAGVFDATHFTTGQSYPYFYSRTSGIIMRASVVPPERFDDRLALTGGEDRLFFTRVHRAGGRFVWDDEAVVDEWVPTSRVNLTWLSRRWFRTGVTRSLTLLYLDHPGWKRRLRRVAGGLLMAARGVFETAIAVPGGRTAVLPASRRILLGLGASYGALGFHLHEYRKTQGS